MIERTRFILAVLAVSLVAASPAAAKKPEQPQPQPPTFADFFSGATLTTTTARPVSFSDIASLEGGEVEDLSPDTKTGGDFATIQVSSPCWTVDARLSKSGWWGYWEYGQRTNWCHNGNVITYRYTQALPARSGGFCSVSQGTWFYKNGGGVNDWYVDVRAGASFSCWYFNGSPWAEIRYTQGGNNWQVAGSDG